MRLHTERGAAAVELALVLPILVALIFGIVDFGRAFNAKVTVTHAAREGARALAIGTDPTAAATAAIPDDFTVTVAPGDCTPGLPASVTVTHQFTYITLISAVTGTSATISSTGSMRCGG